MIPETRILVRVAGGIFLLGLLIGCQAPPSAVGPRQVVLHVTDYDAFMDDALSLLRQYDFPPEYVDRARGFVVSQPATSGQWFEFWRVDARGGYQALESNLHTMRRVVTLNVERLDEAGRPVELNTEPPADASGVPPADAPLAATPGAPPADSADLAPPPLSGRFRLTVRVEKSRLNAPERQITTASGALALYSGRVPTTEGELTRGRRETWISLGQDVLLEDYLLQQLTRGSATVDAAEPVPPAVQQEPAIGPPT